VVCLGEVGPTGMFVDPSTAAAGLYALAWAGPDALALMAR
jgi:hypothetical protein